MEVTVSPSTLDPSGSATGTVTLNDIAPAGGVWVALTSSNLQSVVVPLSVQVPAGQRSATFTATAPSDAWGAATITASYNSRVQTTLSVGWSYSGWGYPGGSYPGGYPGGG